MPTPDSLTLPNINPIPRRKPYRFEPGNKLGKGRTKGEVNRITRDIKNGILTAAENLGRDGKGTDGFIGYLEYIGWNHPKAFAHLLGKMMPLQVNADVTATTTATAINIIAVPHDHYLTPEDIARMNGEPVQIEHTPQIAAPIEETTSPSEEQIIDDLKRQINELARQAGVPVVL